MIIEALPFAVLAVSIAATGLVRGLARRAGVVAMPRADRWNRKPTALLGGVGIFVAFAAGLLVLQLPVRGLWTLMGAATFLFIVGLVDDLHTLRPHVKLVMQVAAASVLPLAGLVLPWTHNTIINDVTTVFWMVGITNAINLLDNMDGLAGGVVALACLFQAAYFLVNGQKPAAVLSILLASAIVGFLIFNSFPASIFMGDCGSLFLGFMLGGTALLNNWGRSRGLVAVLLTPVLIMLVPIVDTSLVTVTRILRARPVSQGGKDHVSHRLVATGLTERRAVLLLYGLTAISGGIAFDLRYLHEEVLYFVVPCFALIVLFFALHLGMIRVYDENEAPPDNFFSFLVEFSYKRRIMEVLFDLVLMTLAYYGAFLLRFGGTIPQRQMYFFVRFAPLVLCVETILFLLGGLYRGLWRYVGIEDVIVIVRCVVLAGMGSAAAILLTQAHPRLSVALLILNTILLLLLVAGSRVALRLFRAWLRSHARRNEAAMPVLIYGAGARGDLLVRQMFSSGKYVPVGFLDDDLTKSGRRLHGMSIYSPTELWRVARKHAVSEVLVSSARISDDKARALGIAVRRV
jgi:UDP-GlcNAc:undecaprenyl-phosphate/decaprenyl-phosphate GlcNAc-1-phosphate transferase